jgi:hypothetical protein
MSIRNSGPDSLLSTEIDKDIYVVTKISKAEEFQKRYPDIRKIDVRGGFVFYRRPARAAEIPAENH